MHRPCALLRMLVDAYRTGHNVAGWCDLGAPSEEANGNVIARARRRGVRCSAIVPMAGQSHA